MVVYTWWCWHVCKGEEVAEVLEQLELKKEGMALGLEFCIDPLCFGSNMYVGCVALCISFLKCLRSSKSDFGAKSYGRSSERTSMTGRYYNESGHTVASPVRESDQCSYEG
jgi:hypothetical protein